MKKRFRRKDWVLRVLAAATLAQTRITHKVIQRHDVRLAVIEDRLGIRPRGDEELELILNRNACFMIDLPTFKPVTKGD